MSGHFYGFSLGVRECGRTRIGRVFGAMGRSAGPHVLFDYRSFVDWARWLYQGMGTDVRWRYCQALNGLCQSGTRESDHGAYRR